MDKGLIKRKIIGFHKKGLPDLFERDVAIPKFKKINKVISIIGPRRSGKTYLMYQIMKKLGKDLEDYLYLNFEYEGLVCLKSTELHELLECYQDIYPNRKPILFLDEIQNIDGWERFVRELNDNGYTIYITGSNSKLLSKEIATELRGRTYTISVYPFSFKEYLRFKNVILKDNWVYTKQVHQIKKLFIQFFNLSGFPEVVLENKLDIIDEYLKSMIYRDILERYKIKNINLMRLLIQQLIKHYSQEFTIYKFNNFLKSNGYASSTSVISKYLDILTEVFFNNMINYKTKSLKKQVNYPSKNYLLDHGFINHFNSEIDKGRLLENIVLIELLRRKQEVFYYKNGFECDFITDGHVIQVTYKLEKHNEAREFKGLTEASKKYSKKPLMITFEQKIEKENVLPIYEWLLK